MTQHVPAASSSRRKLLSGAALVLLLAGAAALTVWIVRPSEPESAIAIATKDLPPQVRNDPKLAEAIKAGGPIMTITTQPTPDQLDAIQNQIRDMLRQRMADYAKMTPEEKRKHIDEAIDREEEMKKHLPPAVAPSTQPSAPGTDVKVEGDATNRRVTIRTKLGGEKNMMEDLTPDLRAALADYRNALNKRRAERGLPPSTTGGLTITRSITTDVPPPAK